MAMLRHCGAFSCALAAIFVCGVLMPVTLAACAGNADQLCRFNGPGVTDCSNLRLTSIPCGINPQSTFVMLTGNAIERVDDPASEQWTSISSVTTLMLDSNQITQIAAEFLNAATSLRGLHLRDNMLTALPWEAFANMPDLEILLLDKNNLTSVRIPDMPNLSDLSLHRNDITSIGVHDFGSLPELNALPLSRNHITSIANAAFRHLTALITLDLDYNRLSRIPSTLLAGLTELKTLDLSSNMLRALPSGVLRPARFTLNNLRLRDNKITTLTADMLSELHALSQLDLTSNGLKCIAADAFRDTTSLASLSMSDNALTTLFAYTFNTTSKLNFASLTGNNITYIERNMLAGLPPYVFFMQFDVPSTCTAVAGCSCSLPAVEDNAACLDPDPGLCDSLSGTCTFPDLPRDCILPEPTTTAAATTTNTLSGTRSGLPVTTTPQPGAVKERPELLIVLGVLIALVLIIILLFVIRSAAAQRRRKRMAFDRRAIYMNPIHPAAVASGVGTAPLAPHREEPPTVSDYTDLEDPHQKYIPSHLKHETTGDTESTTYARPAAYGGPAVVALGPEKKGPGYAGLLPGHETYAASKASEERPAYSEATVLAQPGNKVGAGYSDLKGDHVTYAQTREGGITAKAGDEVGPGYTGLTKERVTYAESKAAQESESGQLDKNAASAGRKGGTAKSSLVDSGSGYVKANVLHSSATGTDEDGYQEPTRVAGKAPSAPPRGDSKGKSSSNAPYYARVAGEPDYSEAIPAARTDLGPSYASIRGHINPAYGNPNQPMPTGSSGRRYTDLSSDNLASSADV